MPDRPSTRAMRGTSSPAGGQRVLLDVGAHYGETLDVVLDPRWGFDRVVCFEPSRSCLGVLGGFRDRRLEIVPAGLSNATRNATLFGSGLLGGSIYADKPQDATAAIDPESIALVRASDWVRESTSPDDELFLKLNCEGSECDVLEDLLASDVHRRVRAIYVDFDVRKIPSQMHREADARRALTAAGIPYSTPSELGANANRGVARWLSQTFATREARRSPVEAIRFRLRLYRSSYMWVTGAARAMLPNRLFHGLARLVGRQARARRQLQSHG